MKKEDLVREYNAFVEQFHLQPSQVIVSAGGACLMYGLRQETEDIDTDIEDELFDQLLASGQYEVSYFGEVEVIEILKYNEYIDLHRQLRKFETVIVEGVCCYSPKELLAQKQKLNRPKDQKDIEALQKMIA